jgi:predicted nucleotidyltransferase component of viral defense system
MTGRPKNIAVSNRAKLLNLSRQSGRAFQELVQYFALSRFLYRLSVSDVSSRFILKGAMLLHALDIQQARSTLDIDLLGRIPNSPQSVRDAIQQVIRQEVQEDGLVFSESSIKISDITKDAGYLGRRVSFKGKLDSIRIPMQIDIGFGDTVVPDPIAISTPTLLGYPEGKLKGYAPETSIAEKTQIMFQRELLNSRMKDFYDIWVLSKNAGLDQATLAKAIAGTFQHRGTAILTDSILFTEAFGNDADKQKQWSAFRRKRDIENAPEQFSIIANEVIRFLKPALEQARALLP